MDEQVEGWVEQQFVEAQFERECTAEFDLTAYLRRSAATAGTAFDPGRAADACTRLQQRLSAYDRVNRAIAALRGDGSPTRDGGDQPARFVIEGEIGRGGMGRVLRARHLALDRPVAIKVPLFAASLTPRDHHRLLREADAASRLDHPGIVRLLESSTYEGMPCLVMELVDGKPLHAVLAAVRAGTATLASSIRRPELDHVQAACEVARQLLLAIDAAHLGGVVHRDLKPSNVMIDTSGRVRVLDFGLARVDGCSPVTRSGDLVGTPQYLPPEQLQHTGSLLGPWTDTYGIGVLLYECLALQHPFAAPTTEQTIARIRVGDATPLRTVAKSVPLAIASVVEKSLCPDARGRYPTAHDFLEDLSRAIEHGRPLARPVTLITRCWRRVKRRPGFVATLAAMTTITIGAATISVVGERQRQRSHETTVAATLQRAADALATGEAVRAQDVLLAGGDILLSPRTPADSRTRHQWLSNAIELELRLERIRSSRSLLSGVTADFRALYSEQCGELTATTVGQFTAAVQRHTHRDRIVCGLHDWARFASPPEQGLVGRVIEAVDDDPLRLIIRSAVAARDRAALAEVALELPHTPAAWHRHALLASAFDRVGDPQGAESVLSRAIQQFPKQVLLLVQLSDLLTKHGPELRAGSIRAALESATHLRPDDGALHARLVAALLKSREYDLALAAARRAVERLPKDFSALLALADVYSAREDTDSALATLQAAEAAAEGTADWMAVQTRRGTAHLFARRVDESLAAYDVVLDADPKNLYALRQVAMLCMIDGRDPTRARELIARGLTIAPDDSYLLGLQWTALEDDGDFAAALGCVDRIRAIDPHYYRDLYTQNWKAAELALRTSLQPSLGDDERRRLRQRGLEWAGESIDGAARACSCTQPRRRSGRSGPVTGCES